MTPPVEPLPAVLAMRPFYVEKLWGGTRLQGLPAKARAGHAPPPSSRTGESWEVADLPEGCSTVDGGPLDGWSLRTVMERYGRAVAGDRALVAPDGSLRFPLLVKLIDAGDDLSVQVHPGDDYTRTHPGTFPKDEAWLVVDVEPGAKVLHGTRDGVDAASFRRAIDEGRAHELLREVRVSVGDVLRIAPGTLHAVGRGCLLLEVQEPSDTTFRVWDYNRKDAHGKTRALHVEQALEVARFGKQDAPLIGDAQPGHRAVHTARYVMSLGAVDAGEALALGRQRGDPAVVFVLDGTIEIEGVRLLAGGSAIVTAESGDVRIQAHVPSTVVVMTPGGAAG